MDISKIKGKTLVKSDSMFLVPLKAAICLEQYLTLTKRND